MWDQNPLPHKFAIDDLERAFQTTQSQPKKTSQTSRLSTTVTTLTIVLAAVFVIGTNIA